MLIPIITPRACDDDVILPIMTRVCPLLRDGEPDTVIAVERVRFPVVNHGLSVC